MRAPCGVGKWCVASGHVQSKVDAYLKEITNLAKIPKLSNELRNITNSPNTLTALFQ